LDRRTLTDQVYELLRTRIVEQEIPNGKSLNITALAKELEVSPTPVREALFRLEQIGLVESAPYRGFVPRKVSPAQAMEVYDMRCVLEEHGARLAAGRAAPAVLEKLEATRSEYQHEGQERGATPLWRDLERSFHLDIAKASGNNTLVELLETLLDRCIIFWQAWRGPALTPEDAVWAEQYAQIVKALGAHDADGAASAMRAHLASSRERLLQLAHRYDQNGDAQEK
jgi:DNA-binding GntR family transcriptional regulator